MRSNIWKELLCIYFHEFLPHKLWLNCRVKWMSLWLLSNDLIPQKIVHKSRHPIDCYTSGPVIYSVQKKWQVNTIFRLLSIRYPLSCNMLMRLVHSLVSLFRKSPMRGMAEERLEDKGKSSVHQFSCKID